jgi:hypothetical protein
LLLLIRIRILTPFSQYTFYSHISYVYIICLYIFCGCILTSTMSTSLTFDISQLSSQTIFALLLFLVLSRICCRLHYILILSYSPLLYTYICTFTHTLKHTSSVLRIFHMICIFLCTICIFTSITTTIPNLTLYYHSYTYY